MKLQLTRKDAPDSKYGREWVWRPKIESYRGIFYVSLELILTKWENRPTEMFVGGYSLSFYPNPKKWKIESFHTWYDGPHCHFQFGPFGYGRDGLGSCKICYKDVE